MRDIILWLAGVPIIAIIAHALARYPSLTNVNAIRVGGFLFLPGEASALSVKRHGAILRYHRSEPFLLSIVGRNLAVISRFAKHSEHRGDTHANQDARRFIRGNAEGHLLRGKANLEGTSDNGEEGQRAGTERCTRIHRQETEGQVDRLDEVFKMLKTAARGKKCEAIEGIIEEAKEHMEEIEDADVADAGMIGSAQARRAL